MNSAAGRESSWRTTVPAGLANYIDSGSIVAGSLALGLWKEIYGLSDSFIGLIAAFSANAIPAGIGAFIGGWSLIAEQAPDTKRGAHSGVAQVLWYLGPVIVLGAGYFLQPFGIDGVRWLFIHLAVLALALTLLRSRMKESLRWEESQAEKSDKSAGIDWPEQFSPLYIKSMLYLISMYGLWNLWAGYNGFFTPYLIHQNHLPQWAETVLPASYFAIGIVSILVLHDPVGQGEPAYHVRNFGADARRWHGLARRDGLHPSRRHRPYPHHGHCRRLRPAELPPVVERRTVSHDDPLDCAGLDLCRGAYRSWHMVPCGTDDRVQRLYNPGADPDRFLVASGLAGYIWAPSNQGKSLEQLEAERQAA